MQNSAVLKFGIFTFQAAHKICILHYAVLTKLFKMNLPNYVCQSYYHYLINRRRKRPLVRSGEFASPWPFSVISNIYILNCIWLIYLCTSHFPLTNATQVTTRKPLIDSSKLASTKCIIGQLRQCLEDEDCVENPSAEPTPEVKVVVTSPNGTANQVVHSRTFLTKSPNSGTFERIGSCTCRDVRQCKRTQQQQHSRNIVPTSENGKLADKRGNKGGKLGFLVGIIISLSTIGVCSFAIYYYGFRYGMIRSILRQLGLTNNTQIEHQLLNRIPSSADDEAELVI